jgi:PAS domain S-box-containing protein
MKIPGSDSGNPSRLQLPGGATIYTAVLDTLQESVFLMNNEFKLVWHNIACDNLYFQVSGKHIDENFDFNELLTDEQQGLFRDYLEKALKGEAADFEWNYKRSVIKWVGVSLYPFTNGEFSGICGSLRDITDKKISEQMLLRNTAVLNNINEGVLLVDAGFHVLAFNKRASKLFRNIQVELRVGMNLLESLPPYRREAAWQNHQSALQGITVEYEALYPDEKWLMINFSPVKNDKGDIKQVSITFRDITEAKQTRDRIKEDEKKYRTLVNTLNEGVILQSTDKKTQAVNKRAERILDTTAERILLYGFPGPDWTLTDERGRQLLPEQLFARNGNSKDVVRKKVVGLQKYGQIKWLRLNATYFDKAAGENADSLVISFADITDQKRISAEVKVLSMVARETHNAVLILRLSGEILWVNEGFTRLTGYTPQEVTDTARRAVLFGPETDMNAVKEMQVAREKGLPFKSEQVMYSKDGRKLITRAEGQPLKNDDGVVTRFFVIVTDITEEKKIMQEMEILSMVAKETHNGVMIFDKNSSETLWINEGFTRLTGYDPGDIVGKNPIVILQGPDTNQEVLKYMTSQIINNLPYSGDLVIYTKNGDKRLHNITGQPFKGKDGEVARYFAISTDVTERRRLEEERLQKEIEQQKEITRVILHTQETERNELGRELHDNINQILAAVNLQLSHYLEQKSPGRRIIEKVHGNIKEAINEIRSLSHKMVMPRFSENTLHDRLNFLLENYNGGQSIHLDATEWVEDAIPQGVKETFFRVAQEQLNNIHKYARANKILVHIKNCKRYAAMSIEDNGVGFSPDKKRTGIGISNIINRVELFNGTTSITSAPGKGCVLSINIPLPPTGS